MSYVVFKLVISEYGLHLMHFLITLNINEMYNLTVKTYYNSVYSSKLY